VIKIVVAGDPAPKGSARAIMRGGRPVLVPGSSNVGLKRMTTWARDVANACRYEVAGAPLLSCPVSVVVEFRLPRGRSVRRDTPSVKPDFDKLLRSTLDALTGTLIVDDAQIVDVRATKEYAEPGREGATILVRAA
jgi:Holliday junction resolvase RusA-like endonuclease